VPASVAATASTFAGNRVASRIALTVGREGGRSRCARIYEDGALRVRFPNDDHLQAIVVNTAGGIAGGDRIAFDIAVDDGAALTLTTAAAEKAYRSLGDDAALDVVLRVAPGGTLNWLPQETILFNEARLKRSIDAELAGDARLLLAEAVVFGRTAMGESVQAGRLFDRWRVRRDGRLIFADTLRLDDMIASQLAQRAVASGGCAVATVLATPAAEGAVDTLRAHSFAGEVGISSWNGITLARLVARDGAALRHDLKLIVTSLAGALPRIWSN
jgi:urease accessory protein